MEAERYETARYEDQLQWIRNVDMKDHNALALCAYEIEEMLQRQEITDQQREYMENILLDRARDGE